MVLLMGWPKTDITNKFDFMLPFSAGNQLLLFNGLKYFSKKKEEQKENNQLVIKFPVESILESDSEQGAQFA